MSQNSGHKLAAHTRNFLVKFMQNIRKGPPKGVKERRGASRHSFLAELVYYAISPKTGRVIRSRAHKAYSLDISVSGARLLVRSLHNCSEIVLVAESRHSEVIALRSKIVRKTIHADGHFEVGLSFLEQVDYPFKNRK